MGSTNRSGFRSSWPRAGPWTSSRAAAICKRFPGDNAPPAQRRRINEELTAELNRRLGLQLTDAFCGFKAYRVAALSELTLTENGYGMPLELWVQAAHAGLRIVERPVPLIYLDETRSFGGSLDDAETRRQYYYDVLERSCAAVRCGADCDRLDALRRQRGMSGTRSAIRYRPLRARASRGPC